MSKGKKALRLVASANPIRMTLEQLCDTPFEAVPEFVNAGQRLDVLEHHEGKLQRFAITSRTAMAVLGQSRDQLIDLVRSLETSEPGSAEAFLDSLTHGRAFADALIEMITAAETR